MYELLLPLCLKGLKGILEFFKEQSKEIRSVPLAVLFEETVLKFLENS